jgi:hypothetical protein
MEVPQLQNPSSRRAWVIPGLVATILFIGAVASNLIASYLETTLKPYSRWVWIMFVIALIVAVGTAIVEARRRDRPPVSNAATGETRIVSASGERSVAMDGKAENSQIVTGDQNVLGDKVDGDAKFRDKITYNIQQGASAPINALHQLRAPVGDFVGRELEIDTLIKALRRESRACITGISGMGGIGKTELALLVANRVSADYPDAQFFINLQGTDDNPRSPHDVMATCIRAPTREVNDREASVIRACRKIVLEVLVTKTPLSTFLLKNSQFICITQKRDILKRHRVFQPQTYPQ